MIRTFALLFVIACGGSQPPAPSPPPQQPPAQPSPTELPASLVTHMKSHGWGAMHLQWHTVRRWDQLPPEAVEYAQRQGWTRAERQEGDAGNGVEFLAMHRAMIELLVEADGSARPVLVGWSSPPTDPADRAEPVSSGAPFDKEMLAALDRLQNHLDSFATEDELGLYIETSFRPSGGKPKTRAADRSAGIHNYLHQRFQDPTSPIDLGNPSLNLMNPRFWRLHGWIDHVWATFRERKGMRADDPAYQAMMRDAKANMAMRMKAPAEAPPPGLLDAVRP